MKISNFGKIICISNKIVSQNASFGHFAPLPPKFEPSPTSGLKSRLGSLRPTSPENLAEIGLVFEISRVGKKYSKPYIQKRAWGPFF